MLYAELFIYYGSGVGDPGWLKENFSKIFPKFEIYFRNHGIGWSNIVDTCKSDNMNGIKCKITLKAKNTQDPLTVNVIAKVKSGELNQDSPYKLYENGLFGFKKCYDVYFYVIFA